jgi:uncharacterized membrane protein YeaQ/YmgE (transglycosylase-associated protein family)
MSIVWTILIGFVVGLLAKMLTPGHDPGGFFITAAIGIVGSLPPRLGARPWACTALASPQAFSGH